MNKDFPQRIVSLVPSLTELLFSLGAANRLVGRTKFCIHPSAEIEEIEKIGGTKNPKIDRILELKPDLILANKEENRKEDIELLSKSSKVLVTEISTVDEAIMEIVRIGKTIGASEKSELLIEEINTSLPSTLNHEAIKTAYFIWRNPWMSVGNDTYIHDVMKRFDLENVFGTETRYPSTYLEELRTKNPELILLSSEPFPFKEIHIQEIKSACPDARVELVNGEYFSWYGSRMVEAFRNLKEWRAGIEASI